MSTALRVENLSKQYRIYDHPGDRLKETLSRGRWKCHREFWALSDVSFEIEAGTTTGIIGPNGSGKSTLLQLITGTLEPTHGTVWHQGRIAALLELGAGFNLEFTGIENVYMNASLIGLSRKETDRLLPEIERFAEIGDFINQPVKTYSSGMYVRVAFATAISTRPDILVIDEALSVGDAVFQHRCLRRIKEMQESGTTILFVSHDPGAVRALCARAILLKSGRVEADGPAADTLNRYQKLIMEREEAFDTAAATQAEIEQAESWTDETVTTEREPFTGDTPLARYSFRHGDRSVEIIGAQILDAFRTSVELLDSGEHLTIRFRARFHRDVDDPVFGFMIRNRHGVDVYGTNTEQKGLSLGQVSEGDIVEVSFDFDAWLCADLYNVTLAVHSVEGESFDWIDGALFFRVVSPTKLDGIANLNAIASSRQVGKSSGQRLEVRG
jgi:ABC-type polysaccharide/polyol phosphate transport system ATPase subunit